MQIVEMYADMIRKLEIPREAIRQTEEIFEAVPEMLTDLSNPVKELERKHRVIDKVFPEAVRNFLKLLCDNDAIGFFPGICQTYHSRSLVKAGVTCATLRYVTLPDEGQMERLKEFARRECGTDEMEFVARRDPSLGGGFVLDIGEKEFDWSTAGRVAQMQAYLEQKTERQPQSLEGIISILRSELEEFDLEARDKEVGTVVWVGDGIANIDGMDHAMYGEIVLFDNGVKGMVQDIRRDEIACILFGRDTGIREGSRAVRTGKRAGIPVGEGFLGRVVDPLGAPIDEEGPVLSTEYRPVEQEAPGIVDRKSVSIPLATGILSIDSMFPIGRGQRELIIGDRQTGKTSIAIDTILNQKKTGVICVYVAIGQKASTIARLVNTLKQSEAMDYTIVVAATASDPAPLQYIAPYSGTALAEYFMHQGKDVLIVYDDLSKHAVAYRALSLLLERSPGREAYPGDVFYLHSRLLERSSRLSEEQGGGSLTALPIIETQAGDVSAYIPTNVISITDGQIFLESDLFFSGMRPAVNVGLSVSRVGGAAQTRAMKKAAGSIRIDLAQYREMEVFTQFSSDLDAATKEQLQYGKCLMELLKQPLCHPLSMAEQVITLCAATGKVMQDLPLPEVKSFQLEMLEWFRTRHPEIIRTLEATGDLPDELKARILDAARAFQEERSPKESISEEGSAEAGKMKESGQEESGLAVGRQG
ncbi:MAG: F0F1 ATP synthase subunit alpha [Lachnospiraceae bacterium]|nr:F0F1 ATP synthase subunit alpha [Lachnospiraceae bacterium]